MIMKIQSIEIKLLSVLLFKLITSGLIVLSHIRELLSFTNVTRSIRFGVGFKNYKLV